MYRKKNKECIFVLTAILFLFLGMCFENIDAADAAFLYTLRENPVSCLSSEKNFCEKELPKVELCTAVTTRVPNGLNLPRLGNRRTHSGRFWRMIFTPLYPMAEPRQWPDYISAIAYIRQPKYTGRMAVLNYIHNQDGKKKL